MTYVTWELQVAARDAGAPKELQSARRIGRIVTVPQGDVGRRAHMESQCAVGNHINPLCAMHRQVKYTRKGAIMSSDMFLLVAAAVGSVLVAFLLVLVAIVRGIRKNASGKRGSASASAPKGDGVHVISRGRDGEILYSENGNTCRFYWEILVGDAMVGVSFPKKDQWDTSIPWAAGRQDEIMQKVAREFVRQQTPGHKVRWADGSFEVLK